MIKLNLFDIDSIIQNGLSACRAELTIWREIKAAEQMLHPPGDIINFRVLRERAKARGLKI
jgi:hypothetical protein